MYAFIYKIFVLSAQTKVLMHICSSNTLIIILTDVTVVFPD